MTDVERAKIVFRKIVASVRKGTGITWTYDREDIAIIATAFAAIREECAKVAEEHAKRASGYGAAYESVTANRIAAAIRQAKEPAKKD